MAELCSALGCSIMVASSPLSAQHNCHTLHCHTLHCQTTRCPQIHAARGSACQRVHTQPKWGRCAKLTSFTMIEYEASILRRQSGFYRQKFGAERLAKCTQIGIPYHAKRTCSSFERQCHMCRPSRGKPLLW
eukprot:1920490-Pleurochrysis_carterae.AAC.1